MAEKKDYFFFLYVVYFAIQAYLALLAVIWYPSRSSMTPVESTIDYDYQVDQPHPPLPSPLLPTHFRSPPLPPPIRFVLLQNPSPTSWNGVLLESEVLGSQIYSIFKRGSCCSVDWRL
jgi:hypothetical protein